MGKNEKGEERENGSPTERKVSRGVVLAARRGRNCTTPPPKWKLRDHSSNDKRFMEFVGGDTSPTASARKLCANLWDFESHRSLDASKTLREGQRTRRRPQKSSAFRGDSNNNDQDEGVNGKASQASLIEYHHRSVERNNDRAIQPVSPASYETHTSMVKVSPYNKHCTDPKFRMVGPSHKTSTELINVLNRIWSLEEQNASNASAFRALKSELVRSRARVEELTTEKELAKRAAGDSFSRARDELEGERKLRKRSEASLRKLSREISELGTSFAAALRELERERKARKLLESLCDEFAKGIRGYELELRAASKNGPDPGPERAILHISEAWLDERAQMKELEIDDRGSAQKATIAEKMRFDIAAFLRAKSKSRRFSLESFPLNEAMSAPRNPAEEGDSSDGLGSLEANNNNNDDHNGKELGSESCVGSVYSPVQRWNSKLATPDFERSECSSRWPRELDESTLMGQLIEARLERRRRSQSNGASK